MIEKEIEPSDTISVGQVSVTALVDWDPARKVFSLGELFPQVPAAAWLPFAARLPQCFPTPDSWAMSLNPWLVRTPGLTVLVDTGEVPATGKGPGRLLDSLTTHGVTPDDVDLVFLTHLDVDHVGGTLTPEGMLRFPRARYVVTRTEWDHAQHPAARARYERFAVYLDTAVDPLGRLGVLDLVAGEVALSDELRVVPAPGHTPGHAGLLVTSEGQQAFLLGDAFHHPAQVTEPGWASRFDDDPALAAATRTRFAAWAAREGIVAAATHFPAPGFGRVIQRADELLWEPL